MTGRPPLIWVKIAIVATIGCIMYLITADREVSSPAKAPAAVSPSPMPSLATGAPSPIAQMPPTSQAAEQSPNLPPPPELPDFFHKSADEQLQAITNLQTNPQVSAPAIIFIQAAIRDKRLTEVTRNNMANTLLIQAKPDPFLDRVFIAMIDDPTESYQWREYCVQHLALSLSSSAEPDVIIAKLRRLMVDGEKGIPGTAMVHLHRLDRKGLIHLDDAYTSAVKQCLEDTHADLLTRMTAVGILAERNERSALPMIRTLASGDVAALRRVAIAALGTMGDASDDSMLQQAAKDADHGIAAAAKAAIEHRHSTQVPADPASK